MEGRINKVHAKNANGFLLEEARRIPHVDVQHDVVWLTTWLELKPYAHPTVGLIRPGIVARGHGVDKGEKARLRPTSFLQLLEELSPLAVKHSFKAFF